MPTQQLRVDVLLSQAAHRSALAAAARTGLTSRPKTLSPVWFYDENGSRLFDQITRLPEYYLTRAERSLLVDHAADIAAASGATVLVELGSGTSDKTRILLDALAAAGTLERYVPLDVSEATLREAASKIAREYDGIEVHAVVGDFHHHLDAIPAGGRRLVGFLGSTIGNLAPAQRRRFLFDLDCALDSDDGVLIGFDLVKDTSRLVAAYDDATGVTAEFNRNALRVLNDTLGATFDPETFEHVATWNASERWIEMHLRSSVAQHVHVKELDLEISFDPGETIRTEISAKFTPESVVGELQQAGFVVESAWGAEGDFMLVLARPYC